MRLNQDPHFGNQIEISTGKHLEIFSLLLFLMCLFSLLAVANLSADADPDRACFTDFLHLFGYSVAGGYDITGDNVSDLLVGAPSYEFGECLQGKIYVFSGADSCLIAVIEGPDSLSLFGNSIAFIGDQNSDGSPDIVIGAPRYHDYTGRVYLYSGEDFSLVHTFTGEAEGDKFGFSVSNARQFSSTSIGDIDDLIIGAPGANSGRGRYYVYLDGSDTHFWGDGKAINDSLGYSVSGGGDVNNDGYDDVVVGVPYFSGALGPNNGRIYFLRGPDCDTVTWKYGEHSGDLLGWSVSIIGDADNNGKDDILVGAPGYNSDDGRAYLFDLGALNAVLLTLHEFPSPVTGGRFGQSVAGAGDIDNNAKADVIIGAPMANSGQGIAYVYESDDFPIKCTFTGQNACGQFGSAVASAGDVNDDGKDDVIIGAVYSPCTSSPIDKTGRAYVYECNNCTKTHEFDYKIKPPIVVMPDFEFAEGESLLIDLDDYVSDPDHPDNRLVWDIEGKVNLCTISYAGHIIRFYACDPNWCDSETLIFRATDPCGFFDEDTAIFTVTPVNDTPVVADIPNQAILEGKTFDAIDLDYYVLDVDNADTEIDWSCQHTGDLICNISPERVATITAPSADWNGSDTVIFRATDPDFLYDEDMAVFKVAPVADSAEFDTIIGGCWKIDLWNTPKAGNGPYNKYKGNMTYYTCDEDSTLHPLYNEALVLGWKEGSQIKMYGDAITEDSSQCFIPASSHLTIDSVGNPACGQGYYHTVGFWTTPDSSVQGKIEYFVPGHQDTAVVIEKVTLWNMRDIALDSFILGEESNWDCDRVSSMDAGGSYPARPMIYLHGNHIDENVAAGLSIYCADSSAGAAAINGYDYAFYSLGWYPDTLYNKLGSFSGYQEVFSDSANGTEMRILTRFQRGTFGIHDTIKICKIKAVSLNGLSGLQTLIDKGYSYIEKHDLCEPQCQGRCGDCNNDTKVNISDAVCIINYVFIGGHHPYPILSCGDANDDGEVNVSDAVRVINYVFVGGPQPGDCHIEAPAGGLPCCHF